MLGATKNLITRFGLQSFFRTLKDSSLKIDSLRSKIFKQQNIFQNSVNILSKIVLNNSLFFVKNLKFLHFRSNDLLQISPACGPNTRPENKELEGQPFKGKFKGAA